MKKPKKGDKLVCSECGLAVIVCDECGCTEVCGIEAPELMCCGTPMKKKPAPKKAAKKPAKKARK